MSNSSPLQTKTSLFSGAYWKDAATAFKDTRMLVFAALIVALRVIAKYISIPLGGGLYFSFDCYINSLGSLVYGPLMGLGVGALSDTLGCILAPPKGAYFFPWIFVEMSSSFIFGLFFWKRRLSISRILTAKFTVSLWCNIILTPLILRWSQFIYGQTYTSLVTLVRTVKSLIMFPLEAVFIAIILGAAIPVLYQLRLLSHKDNLKLKPRHYILVAALTLLAVGLVLFYIFFLKEFISAHNIKLF